MDKLKNLTVVALCLGIVFSITFCTRKASAEVLAIVSLSLQEMNVVIDGTPTYTWKVSTGRKGHETPPGTFEPDWLHEDHYTSLYDDAPMPHSVFFNGHIAVHGTDAEHKLGKVDSHGCIRLSRKNAKIFFQLVQKHKMVNTTITVE